MAVVIPAETLAGHLRTHAPEAEVHITSDPEAAWAGVSRSALPGDLIAITGSVFLAGEMRPLVGS